MKTQTIFIRFYTSTGKRFGWTPFNSWGQNVQHIYRWIKAGNWVSIGSTKTGYTVIDSVEKLFSVL